MNYPSTRIEGTILSAELLDKLNSADSLGQRPADFGLESQSKLKEEIVRAWAAAQAFHSAFQHKLASLKEGAPATTETRNQWIIPLLGLLGYSELEFQSQAELVGNKPFRLSHRLRSHGGFVVHIVGAGESLDKKPSIGPRVSPHALLQEYLNLTEHLYGVVTNGRLLRLLRDSTRLIKLSYVEFDLDRIFSEELFADFAVLYRLLHVTRLPKVPEQSGGSFLERYHQDALDSGARIREGLSTAVEQVLQELGSGFLAQNEVLQIAVADNTLVARELYHGLLRLIYRLLLLMVAEERGLLFAYGATQRQRRLYLDHYSIARLRRLAERRALVDQSKHDLWRGLRSTFRLLETEGPGGPLGLTGLGGHLFSASALGPLQSSELDNGTLLSALAKLSLFRQPNTKQLLRVNYGALASEEFGSVYERLLEFHPVINPGVGNLPPTFGFRQAAGNERKTSGSYYTPSSLVECLLDSALDPVLADRLTNFSKLGYKSVDEAVLGIKVCDPACGSGHFLIAAAQRIARRLALLRSKGDEPSVSELHHTLREVIGHCVYGVDTNPMSVELCKVALWLEAMEAGRPLSFLDHHIRCGNSLIGGTPELIAQGIPDEAFTAFQGDDKKACAPLKKLNARERAGFGELFAREDRLVFDKLQSAASVLENLPDDSVLAVEQKSVAFEQLQNNHDLQKATDLANLWCAAFLIRKRLGNEQSSTVSEYGSSVQPLIDTSPTPTEQPGLFGEPFTDKEVSHKKLTPGSASPQPQAEAIGITTGHLRNFAQDLAIPDVLLQEAKLLTAQYQFFHWHLEFPEVFKRNGFDLLIGNPPWEMVELSEKEFFAERAPQVANATSAKRRQMLISELAETNPSLWQEFSDARRAVYGYRHFVQTSGRFPTSSVGRINLYPLFTEACLSILSDHGRAGIIVPSAISMDAYNAALFSRILENGRLVSLFDFENSSELFEQVHRSYRFCLLTICGPRASQDRIAFCYFAHHVDELRIPERRVELDRDAIVMFSPNTLAPPILKNAQDKGIAESCYRSFGVFLNRRVEGSSPWKPSIQRMLSLSDEGDKFQRREDFPQDIPRGWQRLYSGKTIHAFNHRFATFEGEEWRQTQEVELQNPFNEVETEYYAIEDEVESRLTGKFPNKWLIGYRDISRATDERTVIATIIPRVGCDTHCRNIYLDNTAPFLAAMLVLNFNSFPFDYLARQKVIGTGMGAGTLEQLPLLPPTIFDKGEFWSDEVQKLKDWFLPRALELIYSAWDLERFAEDCGYFGPPFRWQEERRFQLRCEIDAAFFHLYDLSRDDTAYILDTFPIVKRKDENKFGSYRTKDQILRVYDQLAKAMSTGQHYQPSVSPIAASFRVTHPPRLPLVQRIPLDSADKFLLSFIFAFLKQTHEEATFQLLDSVFHLLRQRAQHSDEFAGALGESSKVWLSSYNDNVPNSDFLPFLKRLETDGWIIADRNSGRLRITEKFAAVPFDAWRNYDVSAALRVIAQQPDVVQLVLDQPDTPLASREFVLQKTA